MISPRDKTLERVASEMKAQDEQWKGVRSALESLDSGALIYLREGMLEEFDEAFRPNDPIVYSPPNHAIRV